MNSKEDMEMEEKKILEVAAFAGHVLLQNGAEIFRVEDTIEKIAQAYGMRGNHTFVLSSGIFLTEEMSNHSFYADVRHIPLNSVNLDRVAQVNQLSREISDGKYTVDEAMEQLKQIATKEESNPILRLFAYAMGSGSFCYLFGGSIRDSLAAFLCGGILFCFLHLLGNRTKKTSKIVLNILSGALVSTMGILFWILKIGTDLDHIMIGSIVPLLPGVAFTNAIRDLANEDYISGTVRMVDAILVAVCIAIGVGVVYSIYARLQGGFF